MAAAAIGVASVVSTSQASLVIDLYSHTGSPNWGAAQQTINSSSLSVGSVLTLDVVANVTAADLSTTNNGIQSAYGNIQSNLVSNGAVQGNFGVSGGASSFSVASLFSNGGASQAGKPQDLNGQPGIDLGFKYGTDDATTNSGNFIFVRDSGGVDNTPDAINGSTSQFLLGTVTFTVTSAGGNGTTSLVWVPRPNAATDPNNGSNTSAVWREAGGAKGSATAGTAYAAGSGLTISPSAIPEPGSLALASFAGLGLLARRRRA